MGLKFLYTETVYIYGLLHNSSIIILENEEGNFSKRTLWGPKNQYYLGIKFSSIFRKSVRNLSEIFIYIMRIYRLLWYSFKNHFSLFLNHILVLSSCQVFIYNNNNWSIEFRFFCFHGEKTMFI